jgi:threonine/homoserine/homoserine lactone efflux protein
VDLVFLCRGLILGFAIAAPIGPIGLLCIRRTLTAGWLVGAVSGVGAASADAIYGAVAALGLTSITTLLLGQQQWVRLGGGLFLCYLGLRTACGSAAVMTRKNSRRGLAAAFASTFAFTLTAPSSILTFAAVFAGIGLVDAAGNHWTAAFLVLGVFLGSALWSVVLCGGVRLLRSTLTPSRLRFVDRLSGVALVGFGLLALFSLRG